MTPNQAYNIAYYRIYPVEFSKYFDDKSKQFCTQYRHMSFDELRTIACKDVYYAYHFAFIFDKEFHHETYQAVLGTEYEKWYLKDILNIDIDEK